MTTSGSPFAGMAHAVAPDRGLSASVAICCFSVDRLSDTLASIESAKHQTLQPYEIIVSVDNNPELADRLTSLLGASVNVVRNEGLRGTSANRNVAIAHATGDVVVFLDDDAVAESNWLEELLRPFADPRTMVVGGSSVPAWERGSAPPWFPEEFQFVFGCTGHMPLVVAEDRQVRNPAGSNMAVRKSAFDQLGPWSVELGRGQVGTGGEEAELCLRIRSAIPGALILHQSSAVVHHKVPRTRSTFRYVFVYVYREGIVRALLRKRLARYTAGPLAGERLYLHNLLHVSIPRRLRRFYDLRCLAELAVIIINMGLVGLGFLRGRLRYREG
jgi:cellulose synthase/poly-beta-1,6-N-acetylglucosamine synthase-like glycosyltransferase